MKVKTKGAIVDGNPVGTEITVSDKEGKSLIARGYADKVVEKGTSAPKKTTKKATTKSKTKETTTQDKTKTKAQDDKTEDKKEETETQDK